MNFDFSADQGALREQLRRFMTERCTSQFVRQALEGQSDCVLALHKEMADLGALAIAIPERHGGSGMGPIDLCIFAEEAGRALAPTPHISSIYLVSEILLAFGSESQKQIWLPRLADGSCVGAFAHAEGTGRRGAIRCEAENQSVSGVKLPVTHGDIADIAIVTAQHQGRPSLWLVDLTSPGVCRSVLKSIDPTRSEAKLAFDNVAASPLLGGSDWKSIENLIDRAAVLVAFEQLGGAERALEGARDYALQRMAFGRPIGSFQAIKHMLVEMYVAIELARSNCFYGAWALASAPLELPLAAAAARVSATKAFQLCSKNAIQVHGGAGFTWSSDCHLFYRRSNALALALGPLSMWEDLLIERLRASRAASCLAEIRA